MPVLYHEGPCCHFFPCAARKCNTVLGGIRRFQDSKDKAPTIKLSHHALCCIGEDAVKTVTKSSDESCSIYSRFACQGRPLLSSFVHQSRSSASLFHPLKFIPTYICLCRARLVKWISENNPRQILSTTTNLLIPSQLVGPFSIPSSTTLSRDLEASFEKQWERVANYFGYVICSRISYISVLIFRCRIIVVVEVPNCHFFFTQDSTCVASVTPAMDVLRTPLIR
jgi:hypothetical protein